MRWVNGLLCVLMALFAVVQYNDPDGLLWFLIYAIPAAWAAIAAFRPDLLGSSRLAPTIYGLCLFVAIAGTVYFWPSEITTWWDNELVREGLGVSIVTVVLLIVGLSLVQERRRRSVRAARL
jgi:hypothetical protein